uniref:GCN5-related N-acetyltransferase n=1 Tax=uncultured Thiotrichaceae bacterium TaxID=298394 RepID=A0A6S6SUA2_9GAMM|nr:MAG: GCN5-related N-acetyltransferase [uncultured Thiotrichaceae bacterium]
MSVESWLKLEQAAFSAWPALESEALGAWLLRFADGYTKRANSANATAIISQLSDQQCEIIESYFRLRQQPPVFRIASFAVDNAIDEKLIQRGYQLNDLSLVMTAANSEGIVKPDQSVEFLEVEEWLELFQLVSGKIGNGQATHLGMLQSISSPSAFAVIKEAGQPVCCGLAVASNGCVGLFDIATAKSFRQRGLASKLCQTLIHWGERQGAETVYLQVVANNKAAINLYERLGFRRAYEYWYRVGQ